MRIPFRKKLSRLALIPILSCCVLAGCKSSHADEARTGGTTRRSETRSQAAAQPDHGWDLNCVFERLQNPPEPFHYTYRHNDTFWDADVSPSAIDGTRTAPEGTRPFHATRSDTEAWQNADMNLSAISGMSSTLAIVHSAEQATRREGNESLNGYDTVRYSVDTTRADSIESGLYRATLGAGGSEKGTIWVGPNGCPVKLVMDVEMHLHDGSVSRDHYEEAMLRK